MLRLKAIFLLLTFSFTLVGYNIEVHYCGNEITDISILGSAHCKCEDGKKDHCKMSCNSAKEEKGSHRSCHKSASNKSSYGDQDHGCCKTMQISVDVDDSTPGIVVNLDQIALIYVWVNYYYLFEESTSHDDYLSYIPPQISTDIPIMVQSFLI